MFFYNTTQNGKTELQATASLAFHPEARKVFLMPGAGVWFDPEHRQGSPKKMIEGSLKYLEQLVAPAASSLQAPLELYCFTYKDARDPHNDDAIRANFENNVTPPPEFTYPPHEGWRAGKAILASMVEGLPAHPTSSDITAALSALDYETLAARFSKITLVGHSFGTIQNQDIVHVMAKMLRDTGKFSDQQVEALLQEMVTINVGNIGVIDGAGMHATSFYFCANNDRTACNISNSYDLDGSKGMLARCGYHACYTGFPDTLGKVSRRDMGHKILINGDLPREVRWKERDETKTDGSQIERHLDETVVEKTKVNVSHDFRNYMYGDLRQLKPGRPSTAQIGMSDYLFTVTNNAVMREPGIGQAAQLLTNANRAVKNHVSAQVSGIGTPG